DKPDLNGRVQVLEVHVKKLKLAEDLDLKVLASQTPGFAGAELANLCNEAALMAARRNKSAVEMEDFQDAIERVVAGLEKKNKLISPDEREIVAYHEAGHAIVGWFLEHTDPVLKVSIVPRGLAALGYTLQTPLEDRFLMTTEELNDKICALLGGRVAEEIIFSRISTGAQNDLQRITRMAYAMVAEFGMSKDLGYISLTDEKNPDSSFGLNKRYSEKTAERIDIAVQDIIRECYDRTVELLNKHREELENMARHLLEKEILTYADLRNLLGDRPYGNSPEGIYLRTDSGPNGSTTKNGSAVAGKKENSGSEELSGDSDNKASGRNHDEELDGSESTDKRKPGKKSEH
ncbi:MAG: AAA family ATPase, partial [Balneolaceae bacterium]